MHEVLVNRLGGLSLPRKSVVRLTDRPDMTLDVYRGRKTTIQQQLVIGYGYSSMHTPLPSFINVTIRNKFRDMVRTMLPHKLNNSMISCTVHLLLFLYQFNASSFVRSLSEICSGQAVYCKYIEEKPAIAVMHGPHSLVRFGPGCAGRA